MSNVIVIIFILITIVTGIRIYIRRNGEIRKEYSSKFIPFLIFLMLVLVAVGNMDNGGKGNSVFYSFKQNIFNGFAVAGDAVLTMFIALAGLAILVGGFRRGSKSFIKWLVVIFALLMAFAYMFH